MKSLKVRNSDGQIWMKDGKPAINGGSPSQAALSLAWCVKLKNEIIAEAAANTWGEHAAAPFLAKVLEYRADATAYFSR